MALKKLGERDPKWLQLHHEIAKYPFPTVHKIYLRYMEYSEVLRAAVSFEKLMR